MRTRIKPKSKRHAEEWNEVGITCKVDQSRRGWRVGEERGRRRRRRKKGEEGEGPWDGVESEKELIIRVKRVKIVKEERFHESQSKGIVEKQRGEERIGLDWRRGRKRWRTEGIENLEMKNGEIKGGGGKSGGDVSWWSSPSYWLTPAPIHPLLSSPPFYSNTFPIINSDLLSFH